MKIAINGFGRIGRTFLRTLLTDKNALKKLTLVAINVGPADPKSAAHFFKYDTVMGTYPGRVEGNGKHLHIDDYSFELIAEKDPASLNWKQRGVEWVVECSGRFTKRTDASKHLAAGAAHVLISAPAHDEDISIIPGINEEQFNSSSHRIVSLGSCTTNAFLPLLKVMHDAVGIEKAFMTTIHAYTNTQVLLDVEESDLRRARAAALNIIPTTTGSSDMIEKIIPELAGTVEALSIRVPVAKVSLIDCVLHLKKYVTASDIHTFFQRAQQERMKGIIDIVHEPLVSSDFAQNNHSVIIDALLSQVNENMCKIMGWYDNEWGYSARLKDFLVYVSEYKK